MAIIPGEDVTHVQTGNGQEDGETTVEELAQKFASLAGSATVSTSLPITGDGSGADPVTMTDANLATSIGNTAPCNAVRSCVASVPDATQAQIEAIDGTTKLIMKDGAGGLVCVTAGDLGIGSGGGTTPSGGITPYTEVFFQPINTSITPQYTKVITFSEMVVTSNSSYTDPDDVIFPGYVAQVNGNAAGPGKPTNGGGILQTYTIPANSVIWLRTDENTGP